MYLFNPEDIRLLIRHVYSTMYSKELALSKGSIFETMTILCFFVSEHSKHTR